MTYLVDFSFDITPSCRCIFLVIVCLQHQFLSLADLPKFCLHSFHTRFVEFWTLLLSQWSCQSFLSPICGEKMKSWVAVYYWPEHDHQGLVCLDDYDPLGMARPSTGHSIDADGLCRKCQEQLPPPECLHWRWFSQRTNAPLYQDYLKLPSLPSPCAVYNEPTEFLGCCQCFPISAHSPSNSSLCVCIYVYTSSFHIASVRSIRESCRLQQLLEFYESLWWHLLYIWCHSAYAYLIIILLHI